MLIDVSNFRHLQELDRVPQETLQSLLYEMFDTRLEQMAETWPTADL